MKSTIIAAIIGYSVAADGDKVVVVDDTKGKTELGYPICKYGGCAADECCAEFTAIEVPDAPIDDFGPFNQYIWKLKEKQALKKGDKVTMCMKEKSMDAYKRFYADNGTNMIPTFNSLAIILKTFPDAKQKYEVEDAATVSDWIELWGGEEETLKKVKETVKCLQPADGSVKNFTLSFLTIATVLFSMS